MTIREASRDLGRGQGEDQGTLEGTPGGPGGYESGRDWRRAMTQTRTRILYVEPFEGGSHASFTHALTACVPAQWTRLTLPARHWKWRMRGCAAWAALTAADVLAQPYDLVWASSYVPLAELVGLSPALSTTPRILYFHENQLAFPWQQGTAADRDLHYGFTQLVSALAATRCVFNSAYNRDSFLEAGRALLARMPDANPTDAWMDAIADRSEVLGVPLSLADVAMTERAASPKRPPLIVWNHRWEYDKNPEAFFAALDHLVAHDVAFEVAVCGQQFSRVPKSFATARAALGDRVVQWGHVASAEQYRALLDRADLAVSTARHEFFGIAMLEATHHGARPVVPDRLAYRELFPEQFRYRDDAQLGPYLANLCRRYHQGHRLRADRSPVVTPHTIASLGPRYVELVSRVRRRSTES